MNEFLSSFDQPVALLFPFIGAAIGWLTNYIAVKMLFHPREPKSLLFFSVQGVFPKRQKVFAKKLGKLVSEELISVPELIDRLAKVADSERAQQMVGESIERVIRHKLPEVIPMIAMVLNDEMVLTVRRTFAAELTPFMQELLHRMGEDIENELSVQQIVEEKVAEFSSDKLEEILMEIMRREFRFIELVGGVLGFLIGTVQLGLLSFS